MPSPTRYGDLNGLTRGRLTAKSLCHAEPGIDEGALPRPSGRRAGQGRREAAASDAHAAFTVRLERAPPPAGSLTIEMAISAEHAPVCRQRSELGNDVILSSLRP